MRLLQTRTAELLETEVEAEGCCFLLEPPRASAGICLVHDAAQLASSSGLIQKQSLAFSVALLHHLGENVAIFQKLFDFCVRIQSVDIQNKYDRRQQ